MQVVGRVASQSSSITTNCSRSGINSPTHFVKEKCRNASLQDGIRVALEIYSTGERESPFEELCLRSSVVDCEK